ncbi:MAG: hypothetical protein MUF21_09000 [Gemmatimonadaceae bacterium]|jgi:hypothetical protein|nr:hypothetical protein [Gemmatimonadaceae bacterium]
MTTQGLTSRFKQDLLTGAVDRAELYLDQLRALDTESEQALGDGATSGPRIAKILENLSSFHGTPARLQVLAQRALEHDDTPIDEMLLVRFRAAALGIVELLWKITDRHEKTTLFYYGTGWFELPESEARALIAYLRGLQPVLKPGMRSSRGETTPREKVDAENGVLLDELSGFLEANGLTIDGEVLRIQMEQSAELKARVMRLAEMCRERLVKRNKLEAQRIKQGLLNARIDPSGRISPTVPGDNTSRFPTATIDQLLLRMDGGASRLTFHTIDDRLRQPQPDRGPLGNHPLAHGLAFADMLRFAVEAYTLRRVWWPLLRKRRAGPGTGASTP